MKKKLPVIIAVVLIIVIIAITAGTKILERFSYSKERMDLNAYYGLETGEDVALVLNNEIKEEKGKLSEGRCYPVSYTHLSGAMKEGRSSSRIKAVLLPDRTGIIG